MWSLRDKSIEDAYLHASLKKTAPTQRSMYFVFRYVSIFETSGIDTSLKAPPKCAHEMAGGGVTSLAHALNLLNTACVCDCPIVRTEGRADLKRSLQNWLFT